MAEYTSEEYTFGFENCPCDGTAYEANDSLCIVCGERVKHMDHIHFKGSLYHQWCLMVAALKQVAAKE